MYIPLKVTTDYTLLKSLIKVKDLIDFCIQKNLSSCAICDTNLFGSIEFYLLAKKNNIKPIIGLDVTLDNLHIYLYAKNYNGYKNLLLINMYVNEKNITIDVLQKYREDILCIIPYQSKELFSVLNFYQIYLSYQNKDELKELLTLTNNVVYIKDINCLIKDDLAYLKYLDMLRNDEKNTNGSFYYDDLSDFDREKIKEVVDMLEVLIPTNKRYIPKYLDNVDSYTFLERLATKGLYRRLNNQVTQKYLNRLQYELEVIKKMGFVDYFLIVYDYVLYAKKNNILVGPGRGSAAGSLVSYVIGITDIDPLKYDLLFERFLNVERITMPDIDIDFENNKREQVISYVKKRYGLYHVAGGLTYSTYKSRLVLREVAKLFKVSDSLLNSFLSLINKDLNLDKNLENDQIKRYLNNYQELKNVYLVSKKLEGLKRNVSTHAAGIVISSEPLYELIPMYKENDVYLTGVSMEILESIGFLKMDFLALKNLTTISNIITKIPNFNINNIDLNDPLVYEIFKKGHTDGIFQFETSTFKNMLVKYEPNNFRELVASIALVRPGPSQELETYIKRKKGLEKITYYHPNLESILKETYGVIVYQEQVISILVKMANFTYAEADLARRAMGKKKTSELIKIKDKFIKQAVVNGYNHSLCENVYEHILKFALYGFNKAHSVSYATVSYQMAYLKVHYPILFTFTMLNDVIGNPNLTKKYLNELKSKNIKILKVNLNYSTNEFIYVNNMVYLPFKLIKGLNSGVINELLNERNKEKFLDAFDFFARTTKFMSKNDYQLLINAGVLNDFYNNQTLINNLDNLINYGHLYEDLQEATLKPDILISEEYDKEILRMNEINGYGFFISNHPSSIYTTNVIKLEKITNYLFKNIVTCVLIESIKRIKTKKGEEMAFLVCSDETNSAEFVLFPKNYRNWAHLKEMDFIKVWGQVTKRYSNLNIVISDIEKIN